MLIDNAIKTFKAISCRAWIYLNEELLLNGRLAAEHEQGYPEKELSLVYQVDRARREWEQARAFFEEAADPDLIDHAIYAIGAAERKYIYLLKLAQKEKRTDDSFAQLQGNRLA